MEEIKSKERERGCLPASQGRRTDQAGVLTHFGGYSGLGGAQQGTLTLARAAGDGGCQRGGGGSLLCCFLFFCFLFPPRRSLFLPPLSPLLRLWFNGGAAKAAEGSMTATYCAMRSLRLRQRRATLPRMQQNAPARMDGGGGAGEKEEEEGLRLSRSAARPSPMDFRDSKGSPLFAHATSRTAGGGYPVWGWVTSPISQITPSFFLHTYDFYMQKKLTKITSKRQQTPSPENAQRKVEHLWCKNMELS